MVKARVWKVWDSHCDGDFNYFLEFFVWPGFCACALCTVYNMYNKTQTCKHLKWAGQTFLFQVTFDKLSCPSWSCIQTWSAREQSCRKRALLPELLTDSSVSLLSAELFRAWRPHLPQTHAHTQTKQTDTPCGSSALCNMFFARLQQIKFPSKWISSLAAFGGRATLFSLIFILYPPNKWSTTVGSVWLSLPCLWFFILPSCFSCG